MHPIAINLALYAQHPRLIWKFLRKTHRLPNIATPHTLEEKFLWRKIFDHNPLFGEVCDKIRSKPYAARLCPEILLPKVVWTGTDSNDIPEEFLNERYILKANHASGYNLFLPYPSDSRPSLARLTQRWLNTSFGTKMGEWAYSVIDRKLFVESMIDANSDLPLVEYKIHMCNGKTVLSARIEQRAGKAPLAAMLDHTGAAISGHAGGKYEHCELGDTSMYAKVLKMSETIGAAFDYARIDTYTLGEDIYFGEVTIYSSSGYPSNNNQELRQRWNDNWDLRKTWFLQTQHSGWKGRYADDLRTYLDTANQLSTLAPQRS